MNNTSLKGNEHRYHLVKDNKELGKKLKVCTKNFQALKKKILTHYIQSPFFSCQIQIMLLGSIVSNKE